MTKPFAFLSYSSLDLTEAKVFYQRAQELYAFWVDWVDLGLRVDWQHHVELVMREVDVVVVYATENYQNSPQCRYELALAKAFGRPIECHDAEARPLLEACLSGIASMEADGSP